MKLSLMREFVKLAELQNYSRTAEELYIAQSALSRHIASLEEELRVQLINRTRNSFELTSVGEIVLEDFKRILSEYEDLLDKLSRREKIAKGELHLGVLYYDRDFYVAKIRKVFLEKYPMVKLILHSYQPTSLENALINGEIDMAILYSVAGCNRPDIKHYPFLKIPYSIMYDKEHRFASNGKIKIEDLQGERLLYPEAPFEICHSGEQLNQMLKESGVSVKKEFSIRNYDEVPWIMKDTGAIYISPMVNNNA
ncbi:MAG TPA: LysR family transcriptional regulator, partial [Candidatus Merdenecus merdavium]|nr:LysR family transcriptional regulator [Candidatus Merdenecus merdavium]